MVGTRGGREGVRGEARGFQDGGVAKATVQSLP